MVRKSSATAFASVFSLTLGYSRVPYAAALDGNYFRAFARIHPVHKDTLYFLGDFCIGSKARVLEHRKHIRCRKIFALAGNHDKEARKLTEEFSWLNNLAEISIHGQSIVLCHYAMRVWNRLHHGSWHLYGHSHGRLPEPPTSLSMDVGVDTHDFRPWHYDDISRLMTARAKARSEQNASPDFE